VEYEFIETDEKLSEYCDRITDASFMAFDTEFVSEDSYRPDLCLIQVATDDTIAVIDTKKLTDATPFWNTLSSGDHESIVHAAREEFLFCLRGGGKRPAGLVDVQIAAGLVGLEYPAAYHTLVSKLLGESLSKAETRTDWRRRPLTQSQLDYAVLDVLHLKPLRDNIFARLDQLGRREWYEEEINNWQDKIEESVTSQAWRRVSGIMSLAPRSLAIAQEIWAWREKEAERRNRLPRRILRDDLLVELAKRQSDDIKQIRALRGMERANLRDQFPAISESIGRALALPKDSFPKRIRRERQPQFTEVGQFLSTALGSMCRRAQVAPSLVGSVQDVRDLIAYRLDQSGQTDEPPRLACGWRAEVVGQSIDDLLAGKVSIRIVDPRSDQPLIFESIDS